MKKCIVVLLACIFVLCSAVCSSFAQSDRATLEKNRLRGEISSLEKQRFDTKSSDKMHIEHLDRMIAKKKQQLSDLEANPEQYFYNESQRPVRAIDSSGRPVTFIK